MRTARARYHKALKDIKKMKMNSVEKRTAEAISDNNQSHLWKEIDKVTPYRLVYSIIDVADNC